MLPGVAAHDVLSDAFCPGVRVDVVPSAFQMQRLRLLSHGVLLTVRRQRIEIDARG